MSGRIAGMVLWLLAAVATSAQAQTVEYLHTDALGSVVAVTDANRNVIERREYEPYGSQLTPAVTNGPGYTGHVQDAATGLVYAQQRYYDAQIGRFLSMDPVTVNSGTGANFNRYWYGDNNPYTFMDPTGTCTGSRIRSDNGLCISSGGNTTETYGARQSEGRSTAGGTILDTITAPWGGWDDFKSAVRCTWECQMPGDGSLEANLAALPFIPIVGIETATARVTVAAERGISVLGRHPAYLQLGQSIPSRFFNIPTWIWNRMSPAQQWAANTRFLDRLVARGDQVFLATNAADAGAGTFFARELEYLISRGYTLSDDGWRLLPPGTR
jgi:RHS repeat-associated protein